MLKDNHLIGTTITAAVAEARRGAGRDEPSTWEADREEQMFEAMEGRRRHHPARQLHS